MEPLNPEIITEVIGITVSVYFVPFIIAMAVRAFFQWMD